MRTKPVKGCSELKAWAMRIVSVALARKLGVIMHRMLTDAMPAQKQVAAERTMQNGLTPRGALQ